MTTYHWADLYDKAVSNFHGERPGAQIEQNILQAFEQNPKQIADAIDQVSKQYKAGKITSGWAVLNKHIATHTGPTADKTANDKSERAKRIANAERWIQNAGIHYDTESEVEDELFGDRGMLRDWPDLRERFLQTWREARPIGEQLEQDLHDRSEHWKNTTGVMWTERNRRRLEQEADRNTNAELITSTLPRPCPHPNDCTANGCLATCDEPITRRMRMDYVDLPAELQPQETT